jgi:lipopolysaccharide transport protein LptA
LKTLWLSLLLLSSPGGEGKKGDADKKDVRLRGGMPIEMSAKGGLRIDLEKKIGYAKNDVVIRRADVTVCCDRAVAHYDKDRIKSVECTGRVVIVRPDGTVAQADRAFFEASRDRLKLTGSAKLRSEDSEIQGDEIVYDIAKDKLKVHGSKSTFRFVPKDFPAMKLERPCPP